MIEVTACNLHRSDWLWRMVPSPKAASFEGDMDNLEPLVMKLTSVVTYLRSLNSLRSHRACWNWRIEQLLLLLLLSRFSCVRLCDPIDGSPPGSPVPGILQARTLEWVTISFSNAWKWKVKVKSLSRVRLLATPWTAAYQASPSMGFSRQEYWSRVPLPSPIEQLGGQYSRKCCKAHPGQDSN